MQMSPFSNLLNEHWYSSAIWDKHQTPWQHQRARASERERRESVITVEEHTHKHVHAYVHSPTVHTNSKKQTFIYSSKSRFKLIMEC